MTDDSKVFKIGNVTVAKIEERVVRPIPAAYLFPSLDAARYRAIVAGKDDTDLEGVDRDPVLSIHAWLIRTPEHTILLDTAAGNGKERPRNPTFHQQDLQFLERLAELGISPSATRTIAAAASTGSRSRPWPPKSSSAAS